MGERLFIVESGSYVSGNSTSDSRTFAKKSRRIQPIPMRMTVQSVSLQWFILHSFTAFSFCSRTSLSQFKDTYRRPWSSYPRNRHLHLAVHHSFVDQIFTKTFRYMPISLLGRPVSSLVTMRPIVTSRRPRRPVIEFKATTSGV